jgi:D-glycero-beta-D-manno-heptose-7-phosphate kinase
LVSIIRKFRGKRVLVVGDVMLDVYIRGSVSRISPEAPIPIVETGEKPFSSPGGAANVAANISALGGQAGVVGVIGRDPAATELLRGLKERRVGTSALVTLTNRPTTEKTRIIAHTQQILRIDREVKSCLSRHEESQIVKKACEEIAKADAVVFEDYNKGVLTPSVIQQLLRFAKAKSKIVTVDPKLENLFAFKGVTVMKPNMKEAIAALGPDFNGDGVEAIGLELMARLNCKSIVLTRSEKGMTIFERGHPPRTIPAKAREVFDVSGAGDTTIATLTLALVAGASLFDAATIANYAAGIEVEKLGVATVTTEELIERIKDEADH